MSKPYLKRQTPHVSIAPLKAHRWSADLRELLEINRKKREWAEAYIRTRREDQRHEDFLHLVNNILHCRTRSGRVHAEYPILRRRMKRWESTHGSITDREWICIHRAMSSHNMDHI